MTSQSPNLLELEEKGALYRIGTTCALPYVAVSRLTLRLRLSVTAFKPLSHLTVWQTFEKISSWLLFCLVSAYRSQGLDTVRVGGLWKGVRCADAVKTIELCLPVNFAVHQETGNCITPRPHRLLWTQRALVTPVEGLGRITLLERGNECACICNPNNPIIDSHSFWFRPGSDTALLVVENSKHTSKKDGKPKTDVTSAQLQKWYEKAVSALVDSNGSPLDPAGYLCIWFSKRRWTDATDELFRRCPRLLVFCHDTLPVHLSPVFASLL